MSNEKELLDNNKKFFYVRILSIINHVKPSTV